MPKPAGGGRTGRGRKGPSGPSGPAEPPPKRSIFPTMYRFPSPYEAAESLSVASGMKTGDILASRLNAKSAFRKAALKTHPDHGGNRDDFVYAKRVADTLNTHFNNTGL